MADKLNEIFRTYTEAVRSKLQKRTKAAGTQGPRLFVNKTIELRAKVDELESGAEFRQLAVATRSSFSGDYHGKSERGWEEAVKNFFRRSSYYVDVFEGRILNVNTVFLNYCRAFHRREIQLGYLAPLECVQFAETPMDFAAFQVRRFTADELKALCGNSVNEVFYPWATVDVERLEAYWFIYFTEPAPAPNISWLDTPIEDVSEFYRVRNKYTNYPKPLEPILQQLALFNWQPVWSEEPSADKDQELERVE